MDRVLVTGSAGYLGAEVVRVARGLGLEAVGTWFRRPAPGAVPLDVRDEAAVRSTIEEVRPDAVVHTAYVQSGPDLWPTSTEGAGVVARAAADAGVRLVHVSTDLVFDGEKVGRYTEEEEPRPVMAYGEAKAAAERAVMEAHPGAVIGRASLIYGGGRQGHQERLVLDALDGRADVAFFRDEIRTPVEASELASALLELAAVDVSGIVHLGGADAVDRFELAKLIATAAGRPVEGLRPGRSADAPGRRPRNCALDSSLASTLLSTPLRGVREVLSS